jgi:hypothetical protein
VDALSAFSPGGKLATELFHFLLVPSFDAGAPTNQAPKARKSKEQIMDGQLIGLVAVVMSLGIPLGAMYTYYRVRKLRSEERLAAIARGASVPMVAELSETARSRRSGILLVSAAMGYILTFGLIAQIEREPDTWVAAAFGIIPLAIGIGYFLDATLIRRDLHPSS